MFFRCPFNSVNALDGILFFFLKWEERCEKREERCEKREERCEERDVRREKGDVRREKRDVRVRREMWEERCEKRKEGEREMRKQENDVKKKKEKKPGIQNDDRWAIKGHRGNIMWILFFDQKALNIHSKREKKKEKKRKEKEKEKEKVTSRFQQRRKRGGVAGLSGGPVS